MNGGKETDNNDIAMMNMKRNLYNRSWWKFTGHFFYVYVYSMAVVTISFALRSFRR